MNARLDDALYSLYEATKVEERTKEDMAAKDHEIAALQACVLDLEHGLGQIAGSLTQPPDPVAVSKVAYFHALARGFQGGSENEDWRHAENDVRLQKATSQWRELSRRYH